MKKQDKTILYVGLGLAALLALRYFSKKRTQTNNFTKDEFGQPQLTPDEAFRWAFPDYKK